MKLEEDFLRDLKWSIEETDRKNTYKPSTYYKPSSMKCIRSMYYQATGTDPDISDRKYNLVGICNSGTDIHIRVQQSVEDMINNGIDCEYIDIEDYINKFNIPDVIIKGKSGMETKLYSPKYNMVFMCDGIIKYKGVYYILEIKTETSMKFNSRFSVAEEHKSQANAYSLVLGLNEVMFLYVCRDNLAIQPLLYNVTDVDKNHIANIISDCNAYVDANLVPPVPANLPASVCNYCQYKSRCKGK